MDRLDALRSKYARAQEHFTEWNRALDEWVATMPYRVHGETDPSGWFVTRLVARELPPPELSLIFADMISKLRATLDHIIWGLVEECGNATHDSLTFPCVLDRTDWPSWLGRQLRNVPPEWISAIEQAQPFTAPHPCRHPMYVLHRLDIATKHRMLIQFVPSAFEWEEVYITNRPVRQSDHPINKVRPPGGQLTDGVELARVLFFSKSADLQARGIQNVPQAWAGWGPYLEELDFTGDDDFPDLMAFVGTQIDTFGGAFRRPGPSSLLRPSPKSQV